MPSIRPALAADLTAIHRVIERAYRGDSARVGWTHEADLLFDQRTDIATLEAIVADPEQVLLILLDGETPLGCVNVVRKSPDLAYLGLLCIEPTRQGEHLGRQLIATAEQWAHDRFGCAAIEMTVIDKRQELIAYYERRGWHRTGEQRDFPLPVDPPLFMEVLAKPLA